MEANASDIIKGGVTKGNTLLTKLWCVSAFSNTQGVGRGVTACRGVEVNNSAVLKR